MDFHVRKQQIKPVDVVVVDANIPVLPQGIPRLLHELGNAEVEFHDLTELLEETEIRGQRQDAFRLEFFNIFDQGARSPLNSRAPFPAEASEANSPVHD